MGILCLQICKMRKAYYKMFLIQLVMIGLNSCSVFEPNRQELVSELEQTFSIAKPSLESIRRFLEKQKQERGVDVKLEIAERLEKVQLFEKRLIAKDKEGYVIINEMESVVTSQFFNLFKEANIGHAYTVGDDVRMYLLKSPSYNFSIYYVCSSDGGSSEDWCNSLESSWSICGEKLP